MSIISQPRSKSTRPARKAVRVFGEGLGERAPVYRLPGDVKAADLRWWEQQQAMEEDRLVDRMYGEFLAQNRIERGLDL